MHKNKKKDIIMTFDYELFLGESSGTINKSIIEPVEKILDLFSSYSGKAIFFIDATFIVRAKSDSKDLYDLLKKNIQKILREGHNVELHLHPQWLDASFDSVQKMWSFTKLDRYRLHVLSDKLQNELMASSLRLLQEIILEENPNYRVSAFRAGGWCSQPFESFVPFFKKNGILLDFSVIPGASENDGVRYFDYKSADETKELWRFSRNNIVECRDGHFLEVPCSVIKLSYISFLKNKFAVKNVIRFGDGRGAVKPSSSFQKLIKFYKRTVSLNIDFMCPEILKNSIQSTKKDKIVIVGHPKILSDLGIKCIEYILKNHNTIGIEELKAGNLNV